MERNQFCTKNATTKIRKRQSVVLVLVVFPADLCFLFLGQGEVKLQSASLAVADAYAAAVEDDGVDFAQRMAEIHEELLILQAESNELMQTISRNMKEMGL